MLSQQLTGYRHHDNFSHLLFPDQELSYLSESVNYLETILLRYFFREKIALIDVYTEVKTS